MNSFDIIGIFSEPEESSHARYSWALSAVLHAGVAVVMVLGFMFNPKIREPSLSQRYTMRLMELHVSDLERPRLDNEVAYRAPLDVPIESSPGQKDGAPPLALRRIAQRAAVSNTLLQLDVSLKLDLPQDVPLPSVVLLSSKESVVHLIVPAPMQKETAADVRPTIDLPNDEVTLADVKIASTAFSIEHLKILPATTSPSVNRKPDLPIKVAQTGSDSPRQPTPVTVMSLSDLRMTDGIVPLPNAKQIGSVPGLQGSPRIMGEMENGHGSGSLGSDSGKAPSTKRITSPKNGKFAVVVVGASLEEDYPEIAGVWNGRLAYTVYLHVGLRKSWILQYSLPLTVDATATGSAAHLDAPWPTDMVVPNLEPGSTNADALLARGILNQQGRFEKLAIVFPPQLALANFVVETLEQWQFRPAQQSGKAVAVDVLLIIPEVQE